MTSLTTRIDPLQSQTLSPRLQQAVRLLQMSSLDFAALMRDTLGDNPFLDFDDTEVDGAAAASPDSDRDDEASEVPSGDANADANADPATEASTGDSDDRDLWQADVGSGVRRAEDGEFSALERIAVEASLSAHLHGQLDVMPLPRRDLLLARAIVESLDDDGYLRTALDQLVGVIETDPPATIDDMQIALRRVQALDPSGVAARSVGECLLLQLHTIDCDTVRALARTIVSENLDALAARDVVRLARRLHAPPERVEEVCDRIRRLDPRPGWRFGSTRVDYVVPDVSVKKIRGRWHVLINPAIVPKVRLNQVYARLFQDHRTTSHGELGAQLQEARWTLRNVEQRFSTIVAVAQAIVDRQGSFLEYGAMAMKPLGLREIADAVGIHESTVSRVTNNKYIATSSGVIELKFFFSRALHTANGSACSGTAIRSLLKDLIDAEAPEAPLSDAEITRQLAGQGLLLARRTVTKYRQLLKIESVERRRRLA